MPDIKIGKDRFVYIDDINIGKVRKFCCGIDFRINDKPNALFSILNVRLGDKKLITCIKKIMSLQIPDIDFHWNFSPKMVSNKSELAKYQEGLLKLKTDNV